MSGVTVGIDGSKHSHVALEWALTEAALRQVPLTVLTVNEMVASAWTGQPLAFPGEGERLTAARKAARDAVATATEKLGDTRPPAVTVNAVNGFVVRELLNASADTDLLVVGSRGGGGFDSLRLGSVSGQVTHHARCPVVVVPHTK